MIRRELRFHPEAADDAESAHRWYRDRSPSASIAFLAELDRVLARILENPEGVAAAEGRGTRRVRFRRFPFTDVYRVVDDIIQVVAVAHAARRPGYWDTR